MHLQNTLASKFIHDESGQGITEYGAILAFVAVLIVVVSTFVNGHLALAISTAYNNCTTALNTLNNTKAP